MKQCNLLTKEKEVMSKKKQKNPVGEIRVVLQHTTANRLVNKYPHAKSYEEAVQAILAETEPKSECDKAVPLRVQILNEGAALTTGERSAMYGEAYQNMRHMAGMLTAYFINLISEPDSMNCYIFTAEDAAQIMVLAKLSRTANRTAPFHKDNYVDAATYTAIAGECREIQERV